MDPNLFHLDWERLFEVLAAIVVLAFILERGLALIFEHRLFVERAKGKGLKEVIAFFVSAVICVFWDFDAVSMIILAEKTSFLGQLITAGVVAGGSKAAVKLFRDVLGFQSNAYQASQAAAKRRTTKASAAAKEK